MLQPSTDLGAHIKGVFCGSTNNAGAPSLITAAGTGDNTAVTGATIDRTGFDSCVLTLAWLAALTAAKVLKLAVEVQDSADGTTWGTAVALQPSTTVATGAGNKSGATEFDVNLRGKKQFVRFNFTPDLDATATDTALVTATCQLGGAEVVPAT